RWWSPHGSAARQHNNPHPVAPSPSAGFCRPPTPRPGAPPPPEVRQPQALGRRRDELRAMAAAEKNRLAAPNLPPAARQSVARVIRLLSKEADRVQAQAEGLVRATPSLAADAELLESVQGIGRPTATTVLTELP